MSGVSNIRQVVSNTPAVERIQETQNRSQQTGQEQFARQLEEEAEQKTRTIQDRAEIDRPEEDEEREADEKDGKKGKKGSPGDPRSEEEAKAAEESGEAGSAATEPEANPAKKDDDDDTDEERHVDVVA